MDSNDPQQAAAASTKQNLLVVAPPGCGKTELLALRAKALVQRLGPNQRILALTFTNRAKANLSERLRILLGTGRFNRYVSVRNFHGHAAEIVLAHGKTLGLQPANLIMPDTRTLKRALGTYRLGRDANEAAEKRLDQVKRDPLSDDEVLVALQQPGDELARRVETDRITANQLHYQDLLRHAQRLLRIEEVANLYQQHYGAILVDEFQDMSLQQLDIAMRSAATWRTFAGDPVQGIYSWAGAAPPQVETALRELCGEPVHLSVSYRSSPAVLAIVNAASGRMRAAPLHAFDPLAWPDSGAAAAISLQTTQDEARLITTLSAQITAADSSASVGIIARAGWRRGEIDKRFAAMPDIRCRRWDLAIDDPAILELLRTEFSRMPRNVSPEAARRRILARIDPADVDTIDQVRDALDQLAESSGSGSIQDALRQVQASSTEAIGPGIHLLNAHTGKGQQFDWVFVPGLEEGHIPGKRSTSAAELAEEERVLLVMLSRARHGVVITRSGTLDGRFGPYTAKKCRWWDPLQAAASMDLAGLHHHIDKHYPHLTG